MADGITPAPGPPIDAVAGVPIRDAIFARYSVTDPTGGPGDQWRAHVNFGDGQGDGPVIPIQKGDEFEFRDTHTYLSPGTYTVTVMIALPGSHTPNDNIVTTQVTVAPPGGTPKSSPPPPAPNPRFKASGLTIRTKRDQEFDRTVALFSEPHSTADDFRAVINWADQSITEPGQIRVRGTGRYAVTSHHHFPVPGKYKVTVMIRDDSGREISARSLIYVKR